MEFSRYVIIDCEFTGDIPGLHEIVDITLIVTTRHLDTLDTFSTLAHPNYPETASVDGLAISGYDPLEWNKKGAVDQEILARNTEKFLKTWQKKTFSKEKLIPISNGIRHDLAFLYQLISLDTLDLDVTIDLSTISEFYNCLLKGEGKAPRSLGNIASSLGVSLINPHSSKDDCMATLESLKELRNLLRL